jgi:hypothetical protein
MSVRAKNDKQHGCVLLTLVAPSVSRSVLYDCIAPFLMNRSTGVHLKPYVAFQNDRVVDCVRPMHPGILAFEGVTQTGKSVGVSLAAAAGSNVACEAPAGGHVTM